MFYKRMKKCRNVDQSIEELPSHGQMNCHVEHSITQTLMVECAAKSVVDLCTLS